ILVADHRLNGVHDSLASRSRKLKQAWHELAQEQQRSRGISRVKLIAHTERSFHDRFQRNSAALPQCIRYHGNNFVLYDEQSFSDAFVIDAVVEAARIAAFVDVAACDIAEAPVLDNEHRHGCGVDAGQRSDTAKIVAGAHLDLGGIELRNRFIAILGEVLEQGATDDGFALAPDVVGPRDWRTRSKDRFASKALDEFTGC